MALRVLNLIFLALFVLSVVVQYNDPDPLRWLLVYGGAAVACLLAQLGRLPRWLAGVVGVAALVWLIMLLPAVLGQVSLGEMFREAGMATMKIEEGREAIGLLLVAAWMIVLFFNAQRLQRSTAPTQSEL